MSERGEKLEAMLKREREERIARDKAAKEAAKAARLAKEAQRQRGTGQFVQEQSSMTLQEKARMRRGMR